MAAKRLKSLDLFSGAGGFSLGLERAGFSSMGAVEIDPVAGETYLRNFPEVGVRYFGRSAGDINKIAPEELRGELIEKYGTCELDLLVAGPPCQGFSRIGRAKINSLEGKERAFVEDPRNSLYKKALHFVSVLRPKVVLIENVSGMLHHAGINVAELAAKALEQCGYVVRYSLVNSAWYGVPQSRERVFILGFERSLGLTPEFPIRTHKIKPNRGLLTTGVIGTSKWCYPELFVHPGDLPRIKNLKSAVTVKEALGDLPPFTKHLEAVESGKGMRIGRFLFPPDRYRRIRPSTYAQLMRNWKKMAEPLVEDHICRFVRRDFETFRLMKPGDTYTKAHNIATSRYQEAYEFAKNNGFKIPNKSDFIPPYRIGDFEEKWRKLIPDSPCWTITAHLERDTYSHIHYDSTQARAITPREAARLQSFPDGFVFDGNLGDMFRQIGNAVPPLLASAFGEAIRKQLAGVN